MGYNCLKTSMKRFLFTLSVVMGMMLVFPSCASEMERDAKKMAKRIVELEQAQHRMEDRSNLGGRRMSEQEYQQLARDYIEFANKLNSKYSKTWEQHEEFYMLVERNKQSYK